MAERYDAEADVTIHLKLPGSTVVLESAMRLDVAARLCQMRRWRHRVEPETDTLVIHAEVR